MARKAASVPPVAGAPALPDPAAASPAIAPPLEVEFPQDIALAPPTPTPSEPAIERPPAVPAEEPAPAPVPPAPIAAPPVPGPGTILSQLDEARRQYRAAMARVQADAVRGAPPQEYVYEYQIPTDHPDYNQETDLRKVLKTVGSSLGTDLGRQLLKHVNAQISQAVGQVRYQLQRQRLYGSDADWADRVPDYMETVRQSGIPRMVAVDEQTDRPLFPEFDPVLYGQLLNHGNPGLLMYKLAKEMLGQSAPSPGQPPGGNGAMASPSAQRAADLRAHIEVQALERAAQRPVGILALPAAAGSGTRRTISSVKELTDAEQKYLMDHRPDIWQALKRRAIGL